MNNLFKKVSPVFSVAEQLQVSDLKLAAAQGFKTIINNRPDHEAQGQPESKLFASAAENLGMTYLYVPVDSGRITDQNVEEFEQALSAADVPVLAFCRTGTRCIILWALNESQTRPADLILAETTDAGYDCSGVRGRLDVRYHGSKLG